MVRLKLNRSCDFKAVIDLCMAVICVVFGALGIAYTHGWFRLTAGLVIILGLIDLTELISKKE